MWRYAWTICVLLFGLFLATSAAAQQLRIGYVAMKKVLDDAPQVIAGRSILDQEFRARNDSIEMDELRAQALEARLVQADLSAEIRFSKNGNCGNCAAMSTGARKICGMSCLSAALKKSSDWKMKSTSPFRKLHAETDTT